MTTENLITKLTNLNINHSVTDFNGYNMDIDFTINGKLFSASYTIARNVIERWSVNLGYDNTTQESRTREFNSFNQLIAYANKK